MILKLFTRFEKLVAENTSFHLTDIVEMDLSLMAFKMISSGELFLTVVYPTNKHLELNYWNYVTNLFIVGENRLIFIDHEQFLLPYLA